MAYQARLESACSVSLPWVRIPLSPPFDSCNLVAWKGTCNQNPKIPVFIIRYNTTSYTGALRPSPYRSFISTAYPLYSRRICAKLHPGGLAAVRIQPDLQVRPVAGAGWLTDRFGKVPTLLIVCLLSGPALYLLSLVFIDGTSTCY